MAKLHIDMADITLVVLFFIGVGVLVICSLMIIKPFLAENALRPANCTLEEVRYHGDRVTGAGNNCLVITVSYTAVADNGVLRVANATLYGSAEQLNHKCSVTNTAYFDSPNDSLMINSTAPCWYNPLNTSQVLARREHSYWGTVHSVLWPSAIILGTSSLFIARRCTPQMDE